MVRTSATFSRVGEAVTDPTSGLLDETVKVAPLIQTTPSDPSLQRHFSAFALTSHLHSPVLRLVSLHPSLFVSVSFLRIPEIHDGFAWKCFFSRNTAVQDVIESVLDSLGLTRSLPVPGGGAVHYVLEEVWAEGDAESASHVALAVLFNSRTSSMPSRGSNTFSGHNLL
jgi:diaphanous 1